MYGGECAQKDFEGRLNRPRMSDIKAELNCEIHAIQNEITNWQERLRIATEKLKLVTKDKNLEAYLNLNR